MESKWNRQYFLSLLLALLFAGTIVPVTESAAQAEIRREVGGNATFHCRVDKHRTVQFFYFQKGGTLVNGFHRTKNITNEGKWENTKLDPTEGVVYMHGLNVSHSGDYTCHVRYTDGGEVVDTTIRLSVTSRYRKPSVTTQCRSDGQGCLVTCSSDGGYPGAKIKWNVAGTETTNSQMCRVVNNSEVASPATMMYNSSSTAFFNCTNGPMNYSCSVGDATSDRHLVCGVQANPLSPVVIAAIIFSLVIVVVVIALCFKKRHAGRAARSNARQDEALSLNGDKEGKEVA